ncbi:MAG TPA: MFS transporter [Acidimicrobiales bacterium]|nr:MFS transporter [Acidimicrobiales bacterium]
MAARLVGGTRDPHLAVGPERPGHLLGRLIVVVVLADMGIGLAIPLWALRARDLGLSLAMTGLLVSLLGAGRLLASLAGGLASDRWGRRRVLVVGLACLGLAALGGGLTPVASSLFPLRLLEGVGWELMAVTGVSALADLVRDEARQGALAARYQAARRGSQAISPLLGGVLGITVGIPRAFDAYAGLALLAAVLAWRLLPPLPAGGPRGGGRRGSRALLADPGFGAIGVLGFFLTGTDLAFQQLLVPTLGRNEGLSTLGIGAVLASFGAVLAAISLGVGGRLIDRFGARLPLGVGVSVAALGYALVPGLHGFAGLVAGLAVAGFGRGLSSTSPTLLLLQRFPERQGQVQGAYRTANGVGRLSLPVALGGVALGPAVWVVATGLGAAAMAVVALTRRPRARQAAPPPT